MTKESYIYCRDAFAIMTCFYFTFDLSSFLDDEDFQGNNYADNDYYVIISSDDNFDVYIRVWNHMINYVTRSLLLNKTRNDFLHSYHKVPFMGYIM